LTEQDIIWVRSKRRGFSPRAAARHSQYAAVQGRAAAEGDVAARPLDQTRARELVARGECHEYDM